MPVIRKVAKLYQDLDLDIVQNVLKSKYHEERLCALVIFVLKFEGATSDIERKKIYQCYVKNFKFINNWDLVDVSCPRIVGGYLLDKDRKDLYKWAKSKDLWTKRIAMVSNWWLIRSGDLSEVFDLAKIFLEDDHDLMHKATGWMLREAGKKDQASLMSFLNTHHHKMPRTMLRYAIEKLPEKTRKTFLKIR